MKKWKIALVTVCAAGLLTATYAASAGSQNDPLITLSYLKNVFSKQVQEMVDTTVAETKDSMDKRFDQAISDWDSKVQDALGSTSGGSSSSPDGVLYTEKTVGNGKTLTVSAGCEFLVRSGGAAVTIPAGASLIDETMGSTVSSGQTLVANHLYMANGTCTVKTAAASSDSGTVKDGPLNVRSGPGTSHSIVTKLEKGTKVTVLGESSGWYQISCNGITGYVLGSYITRSTGTQATSVTVLIRGNYSIK